MCIYICIYIYIYIGIHTYIYTYNKGLHHVLLLGASALADAPAPGSAAPHRREELG